MANTTTSKNMTFPPESPRKGHKANVIYVFTSWTKMSANNCPTNSTLLYILNVKSLGRQRTFYRRNVGMCGRHHYLHIAIRQPMNPLKMYTSWNF